MKILKLTVPTSGTLYSHFKKNDETISSEDFILSEKGPIELQIEGHLNSSDIVFLRELCGGRSLHEYKKSQDTLEY